MQTFTTDPKLYERRERVFIILAAFFLGAVTMLNIIGLTRFIQLGPLALAVGVLPYPLTFLCTDLISELYGRARANFLVLVGFFVNMFVILIMFLGQLIPAVAPENQPPWQVLSLAEPVQLPTGLVAEGKFELFDIMYACMAGSVFASMIAYTAAQFVDVQMFHFWKRLTKGKHKWIRNNFSTMVSQMVDSIAVISISFGAAFFAGDIGLQQLLLLIGSSYLFKLTVAAVDTGPFYLLSHHLARYLKLPPSDDPSHHQRSPDYF